MFRVRDLVLQAHARGRKPPRGLRGQYQRDLQWVSSPEARVPFSFGWVCLALGLEPSAVRRRYLGGQPAGRVRRSVQGDRPVLSPPAAKRHTAAPGPV